MPQQTLTIQQWGKTAHETLATTEPIVSGKLGPKAMTPDVVYRALVKVWTKLREAGEVTGRVMEAANGMDARLKTMGPQLEQARKLIEQQHGMLVEAGVVTDKETADAA